MIELIVDNQHVVLDPETSIRIEYNNPVFADDGIPGSKTYWFDIPIVTHNQRLFGFAEIAHVSGKYKMFDNARVVFQGYTIMTGKFALRKVKEKYRGALTTNVFGNENKEKRLNELSWETFDLGSTTGDVIAHANAQIEKDYPDAVYNFPVIENPHFYDDENESYHVQDNRLINRYDVENDTFQENEIKDEDDDVISGVYNNTCLLPCLYLREILKKIFSGYQLIGDFIENSIYAQLLVYNQHSLDDADDSFWIDFWNGETRQESLKIYWKDYDSGKLSPETVEYDNTTYYHEVKIDYAGYYKWKFYIDAHDPNHDNSNEYDVGVAWGTAGMEDSTYQEKLKSYVRDNEDFIIEGEIHVYIDESYIGDTMRIIFDKPESHDSEDVVFNEATCSVTNYSESMLNRFAKEIKLKNHVPAKLINEALNDLKDLFGLCYFFDEARKRVQLFLRKDIFDTDYIDLTDKVDVSTYQFELSEKKNKVLQIDFEDDQYSEEEKFRDYSDFNMLGSYDAFEDIPPANSFKDIVYVASQNAIYKTRKDNDYGNTWKHYTDIRQSEQLQDEGEYEEKKISAGPMLMRGVKRVDDTNYTDSVYPVPKIDQKGFSIIYNSGRSGKDYQLRLMHWLGKKTYSYQGQSGTFPAATSAEYDLDGYKANDFSLFLNGSNGVAEYFHRKFEDFMSQTEQVRLRANPAFDIANLLETIEVVAMPQSDNQKRWLLIDNVKYLPKRVDVEISMQGIENVRLEILKQSNG